MVHKDELSLNTTQFSKKIPCFLCWSRFHSSSYLPFSNWFSLKVFCYTLVSWISKKLRVTSPLLIVLVSREKSHGVLTTFSFIRRLWPHPIQWVEGNVGIIHELLGELGYFHSFIPPHWAWAYLGLTSFIEKILSCSLLNKVRHNLGSILRMSIITQRDDSGDSTTCVRKTPVQQELVKMYHLYIPPPEVVQKQVIHSGPQFLSVCGFARGFSCHLRGFTCVIFVSVQY